MPEDVQESTRLSISTVSYQYWGVEQPLGLQWATLAVAGLRKLPMATRLLELSAGTAVGGMRA